MEKQHSSTPSEDDEEMKRPESTSSEIMKPPESGSSETNKLPPKLQELESSKPTTSVDVLSELMGIGNSRDSGNSGATPSPVTTEQNKTKLASESSVLSQLMDEDDMPKKKPEPVENSEPVESSDTTPIAAEEKDSTNSKLSPTETSIENEDDPKVREIFLILLISRKLKDSTNENISYFSFYYGC